MVFRGRTQGFVHACHDRPHETVIHSSTARGMASRAQQICSWPARPRRTATRRILSGRAHAGVVQRHTFRLKASYVVSRNIYASRRAWRLLAARADDPPAIE